MFTDKMDLPAALPGGNKRSLSLDEIEAHPWQIVPSNALDDRGCARGPGLARELSQQVTVDDRPTMMIFGIKTGLGRV